MPVRGNHLEKWRVLRTIGEGAQGRCKLVERKSDGELAVRKQVDWYTKINSSPLEAIILNDVLPPSRRVVKLITFWFTPSPRNDDYLIELFEYCRGGDLEHAVTQYGRLSEDFIWHCFIQIAEALDVVHNAGSQLVVHRDVKPDNIFLEQKYRHAAPWPNLKLGDFGAATLKPHTEAMLMRCWQGPELPHHSTAGDIWGLGAIIHWMGHRRPPITPRPARFSQKEWESQPAARRPTLLPKSYSLELNDCMMECLRWDPRDRISSHELVKRLKRDRHGKRR